MRGSFFSYLLLLLLNTNAQNRDIRLLDKINSGENLHKDIFYAGLSSSVTPISIVLPVSILVAGDYHNNPSSIRNAYFIGSSVLATALLTTTLKYSLKRQRPFVENSCITKKCNVGKLSFPSGHTSSAFATATSLSLAYPRWYVIAPSFLWASSVAYSRMYLGVHYPTDVLGGMLIGIGVSCILWEVEKRINK
ncbi:MAG: phosphatase PAP2 family protein [Bacteroidetes bacterium]|nr:phosphatase PAP2 family protein [Bacteroidota bacterium]